MKSSALRRHQSIEPRGRGVVLSALDPAHRFGRTLFPSRVFEVGEVTRVLIDGHQSRKIGKIVQKGRLRGRPIFTLTLEERATCPRTCAAWSICYGNNMQAAQRIVAGPALEARLWDELEALQSRHPRGFLVSLHILGDFYSVAYVDFWRRALDEFPALHVFGFTARLPDADPIGAAVEALSASQWDRFLIRVSGRRSPEKSAIVSDLTDDLTDSLGVVCPAQTGASLCCATCALCFTPGFTRSIVFRRH